MLLLAIVLAPLLIAACGGSGEPQGEIQAEGAPPPDVDVDELPAPLAAKAALMGFAGAILVAMGVLVLTGELFRLNVEAQRFLDSLGLDVWSEV